MSHNPYLKFVSEIAELVSGGKSLPLGGLTPSPRPTPAAGAGTVLIFAPHPDDECIIGGLPLRLLREAKMSVVNVAVTQGSNRERQAARLAELAGACGYLGFELLTTREGGLERINPATRAKDPAHWKTCVEAIAAIIAKRRPRVVFMPHDDDWNITHIGTHHLVADALSRQTPDFTCAVIETEFWGAMKTPNLMVESSVADLADLVAATAFHVEEVKRNPYHLLLPPWMMDNVRRGGELVGGQGGAAPDFTFSTLYRMRQWRGGTLNNVQQGGRQISIKDDPAKALTAG